MKPVLIAAAVGLVILTECLFAYFLIPSKAEVEAWTEQKAEKVAAHEKSPETGHTAHPAKHGAVEVEVDLGKYNVVVHQPSSNVTVRVNFHLIATLPEEENVHFAELLAKNQHRLRDQVIFEIRNCQIEDLTDPGLALLKRRILAKSNDLLGKPVLHTVVFSDFSFIEQ